MLPIGDEPRANATPYTNYILIAINVLVFVLIALPLMRIRPDLSDPAVMAYLRQTAAEYGVSVRALLGSTSAYDVFVFQHGFRPADASVVTIFSSMFMHAGWGHLLGNMLFLWIFGHNVEARLGHFFYAIVYLATGVLATCIFALFQRHSGVPLIGASGAISGILGCYFVWFPRFQVRVFMFLFFIFNIIMIPARWVLVFFIIAENLLPLLVGKLSGRSTGSVAYGAHLGGFFAGLLFAYVLWYFIGKRGEAWREERVGGRRIWNTERPGAVTGVTWWRRKRWQHRSGGASFGDLVRAEKWKKAYALYKKLSEDESKRLPASHIIALSDALTVRGESDVSLSLLQRYISLHPSSSFLARIHFRAGLLLWQKLERNAAAKQHFFAVLELDPEGELERATRSALKQIERM